MIAATHVHYAAQTMLGGLIFLGVFALAFIVLPLIVLRRT